MDVNLLYLNTAWKQKTSNHKRVIFLLWVCLSCLSAEDKSQLKILPEHSFFPSSLPISITHFWLCLYVLVLADKMNQQMTSAFYSTI